VAIPDQSILVRNDIGFSGNDIVFQNSIFYQISAGYYSDTQLVPGFMFDHSHFLQQHLIGAGSEVVNDVSFGPVELTFSGVSWEYSGESAASLIGTGSRVPGLTIGESLPDRGIIQD
jgi:hypothetical protein